jgi:phosphatidylglycerophosphate synthase
MLSKYLGHFFDKPLTPLAKRISIHPNIITVTGFVVTTFAAIVLTKNLFLGGVLILIGGVFDMLDGVIARVNNRTTSFGAFLDSVLDRYSDSFLLIGFSWYFFIHNAPLGMSLSVGTLVGSLIISYTRARAEGLGKNCHTGIMERPERIILMIFGALTGLVLPVMWVLFVFTHVTVIQRIYHVWKIMK